MKFDAVYYEPAIFDYPLGRQLREEYRDLPWIPIESHNSIREMQEKPNDQFGHMKRNLIAGIRKTHKYVENHKVSDYLVPYTSSGCTAMCLYCYLVCNYNKCAYLRLFVNREDMLDRLIKRSFKSERPLCFEIGSNSDLILENTITGNLLYTIPRFAEEGRGKLTFPSKFHMVDPLLTLDHRGKVIFRMSVNPQEVISRIELGTSPLQKRIEAVNRMCEAGYPCGLLIAPGTAMTIGNRANRDEHGGLWYNLEGFYNYYIDDYYPDVHSMQVSLSQEQLDAFNAALPNCDKWSGVYNCVAFTTAIWNAVCADRLCPVLPTPEELTHSMSGYEGKVTEHPEIPYDYVVYYGYPATRSQDYQ